MSCHRPSTNFSTVESPKEISRNWKNWTEALEVFLQLTKSRSDDLKKLIFLNTAEIEVQQVLKELPEAANIKTYSEAIGAPNTHFTPERNICYERFLFYRPSCMQGADEPMSSFVHRLEHVSLVLF